jgi:hypothetical protein
LPVSWRDSIPEGYVDGFLRIWRATDNSGNWSECIQRIELGAPTWELIDCPQDTLRFELEEGGFICMSLPVLPCGELIIYPAQGPLGSVTWEDDVLCFVPPGAGTFDVTIAVLSDWDHDHDYELVDSCPMTFVIDVTNGLSDHVEFYDGDQLLTLRQNYPNPFNSTTTIEYVLARPTEVTVTVFNALGQRVSRIDAGRVGAGSHRIEWDGRDESGLSVSSGVYFYKFSAGNATGTGRMLLLK